MTSDDLGLPQSPAQAADPIRDGMLQALKKARELVEVMEGLTSSREDDDWLWDIRGTIQAAIHDEAEYRAFLRGTLVPERAAFFASRHPSLAALSADAAGTIAAARKPEWMPIDSAPKDGVEILLAEDGTVGTGFYDDAPMARRAVPGWFWEMDRGDFMIAKNCHPTHWMPLPAPPLPPSSSPEDQEKAAATPTIADPDGEARS